MECEAAGARVRNAARSTRIVLAAAGVVGGAVRGVLPGRLAGGGVPTPHHIAVGGVQGEYVLAAVKPAVAARQRSGRYLLVTVDVDLVDALAEVVGPSRYVVDLGVGRA